MQQLPTEMEWLGFLFPDRFLELFSRLFPPLETKHEGDDGEMSTARRFFIKKTSASLYWTPQYFWDGSRGHSAILELLS